MRPQAGAVARMRARLDAVPVEAPRPVLELAGPVAAALAELPADVLAGVVERMTAGSV